MKESINKSNQQVDAEVSEGKTKYSIPIYVEPFYNSNPLKINVGKYSDELLTPDLSELKKIVLKIEKDWDNLKIETMYVVSIRLYELGARDESVFMFYSAQYRGKLFAKIANQDQFTFSYNNYFDSFFQLVGPEINGYAYCNFDNYIKSIEKTLEKNSKIPNFETIYSDISFIDKSNWDEMNQKIKEGLEGFVPYLKKNQESIIKERDENGMTKKYCN